jgi:hypothetical protein
MRHTDFSAQINFSHNIKTRCRATMIEAETAIEVDTVTAEGIKIVVGETTSAVIDPDRLGVTVVHVEIVSENLVSQHHSIYCL